MKHILNHYNSVDPVIYAVIKNLDFNAWMPTVRSLETDYFKALALEIIYQQLSGKAAKAIADRFENLFENKLMTPEKILELDDQNIRDVGLSWAKIKYVKDLSYKVLNKEVNLDNLNNLSDAEVVKELTKVKGIGNWTAEMFLIFTLKREDVFSFGDLGLKKGIEKLYNLQNPSVEQIEKIIAPWSPYKTYGTIALWRSLEI